MLKITMGYAVSVVLEKGRAAFPAAFVLEPLSSGNRIEHGKGVKI